MRGGCGGGGERGGEVAADAVEQRHHRLVVAPDGEVAASVGLVGHADRAPQ